jgi:hypothetical protein
LLLDHFTCGTNVTALQIVISAAQSIINPFNKHSGLAARAGAAILTINIALPCLAIPQQLSQLDRFLPCSTCIARCQLALCGSNTLLPR